MRPREREKEGAGDEREDVCGGVQHTSVQMRGQQRDAREEKGSISYCTPQYRHAHTENIQPYNLQDADFVSISSISISATPYGARPSPLPRLAPSRGADPVRDDSPRADNTARIMNCVAHYIARCVRLLARGGRAGAGARARAEGAPTFFLFFKLSLCTGKDLGRADRSRTAMSVLDPA